MGEKIEIGKEGFKFSYHRFVSDSALGFFFILLLFPKFLTLKHTLPKNFISSNEEIFIAILLIFLSTPLGLLINGISWIVLENISDGLTYWGFKHLKRFPIRILISKDELLWNYENKVNFNSKDYYQRLISLLFFTIDVKYPEEVKERLTPARAGVKFARGLAFLSFIGLLIYRNLLFLCFFFLFLFAVAGLKLYVHSELMKAILFNYTSSLNSVKKHFLSEEDFKE
jgi:hypothetical protein